MTISGKAQFTVLLMAACTALSAQPENLVPNPGFEEYVRCPGDFSESPGEFSVTGWRSATRGTPDHFHACSRGDANVPYNWAGVADAFEGDGYAGIFVWMNTDNQYREYLQCQLTQPLLKDSSYRISFRYKLSSYSKYAADRIGLLLTDTIVTRRDDRPLKEIPTLSVIQDSALTRTTGLWEKAAMDYKARGGERYLTIGNFFDNETTGYYRIIFRNIAQPMLAKSAYYYVDNVEVAPKYLLSDTPDLLPDFSLPEANLNVTYVLDNIEFEFDSYKLSPSSFEELDQVVAFMNRYPHVRVRLSGHTDDLGSERYNQALSANRARSVSLFLRHQGIDASRIETFGFGKTRPLLNEQTAYARSVNRRVEIMFIR